MDTLNSHFLLKSFTDYYQELAAARLAITNSRLAKYLNVDDKNPSEQWLVTLLFKRLRSGLLSQQRRVAKIGSASEQNDYQKLLYLMCILTDELLILDTKWDSASLWEKHLLETAFFDSAEAGTKFFTQIDELINDRVSIDNRGDLAAAHLMAISLGFRGRYRSDQGQTNIQKQREKLFGLLETSSADAKLFFQAYQYSIRQTEDPKEHRLSPLSRWYRFGGIALFLYLVISTSIWYFNAAELNHLINALNCGEACAANSTSDQQGSSTANQDSTRGTAS